MERGAAALDDARRARACLAAVLALVAAAHAASLAGGFVWDDRVLVHDDPAVVELHAPAYYFARTFFAETPSGATVSYYRPLATLSLALDYSVWDGGAFGFRLSNLLAHLACTALVFALALRAGAGAHGAALAALCFGVFPRGTEAVDWISGRTDLLASAGALGALLLHDCAPRAHARRAGAATALLLGLLAKETALAALPALVALEVARARGDGEHPRVAQLAPALAATALVLALRAAAGALASDGPGVAPVERAGLVLGALGAYASLLADPLRPALTHALLEPPGIGMVLGGALALGALATLICVAYQRATPLVLACALLAVASLVPALHVVPFPVRYLTADRYLYLPVAAAVVAIAGALAAPARLRAARAVAVASVAALAVFLPVTALRAALFCDETALWEATLERADPRDALPHAMLGESLLRDGRSADALPRLERALALDRAVGERARVQSLEHSILGNLAGCRLALGHADQALEALDTLVARRPDHARHHYNRGVVHARLGHLDQAALDFDRALELSPGWPAAGRARRELRATRTPGMHP